MTDESSTDDRDGGDDRPVLTFAAFLLFEAALTPLALLAGWLTGQPPLGSFAWDARAALEGLVAALPMMALLLVTLRWPVGPFGKIREFFDRELAPVLEGCRWPDLALISVAAGVGEEMLFRGVLQGALTRFLGPFGAAAAAGGLFGLLHPVSATYAALAAALGTYLGVVWVLTGNLLAPVVAHAAYDLVALLVLFRTRRNGAGGGDEAGSGAR